MNQPSTSRRIVEVVNEVKTSVYCLTFGLHSIFMRQGHQGNRDRKRGLGGAGYGAENNVKSLHALAFLAKPP